jgi:molybdopterin/thiamine biosynthesis adenylyltransferase
MGFMHSDIDPETGIGIEKALVAERIAKSIDPEIEINLIKNRLESEEAFEEVKTGDIVIGSLDSDGARSILNELCIAYEKPYIDLASEVFSDGTFGGRVAMVMNGDGCLHCMGDGLDQDEVRRYLTGEEQLQNEAAVYGVDRKHLEAGSGPSVVDLNGIIGSMGVLEYKTLVTGGQPSRYLNFRGHLRTISKGEKPARGKCYLCSQYGKGAKADVERYLKIFGKK